MQIYWISDGEKHGPASVPDVESMLQLGELSPTTLGWHTGCEKWMPLRELPALADAQLDTPPEGVAPAPPISVELGEKLPPHLPSLIFDVVVPGPMARFLARMVDMALYTTVVMGILYMLKAPYSENLLPGGIVFWAPLVVIEACLIYLRGATPGKWLLGIRMQFVKGRTSYLASFVRSAMAFVLGLGCMFPVLVVVMLAFSYFSVRRRGVAIWDVNTSIVPMIASTPPTALRKFYACLLIYLCMVLSSAFIQPWLPDILDSMRERDPVVTQAFEEWLNMRRP